MADERLYAIAAELLDCAQDALGEDACDRACVIAGALAWDDCAGACCQLTVGIDGFTPSANFPTPAANTDATYKSRCGHPLLVVTYTVTILRCAPVGVGENAPTCEALDAYAQQALTDATSISAALQCCLNAMRPAVLQYWSLGPTAMVGPAGGCGGSARTVTVGLKARCPCETV